MDYCTASKWMFATAQDKHCPLVELPDELLVHIVEELLPSKDLLALRATCRTFERLAIEEVAQDFFDDRSFILANRDSMDALRELSAREDFFKSFYSLPLTNGLIDTSRRRPKEQRDMCPKKLRKLQAEQDETRAQQKLFRGSDDIDYLVEIFSNF